MYQSNDEVVFGLELTKQQLMVNFYLFTIQRNDYVKSDNTWRRFQKINILDNQIKES